MHNRSPLPFDPLPGTEPPRRGLFIDRWGTLLELPARGYCSRFEKARFTPGAVDALFRAGQAGWRLYLIGNEEAVAFGQLADSTWARFEEALLDHLKGHGVPIRRNYACLDHPEGKGHHQRPSVYLLPNTGAMYHAAQVDGVRLSECWVVGDSTLEMAAGSRSGCRTAAVETGLALADGELHIEPDVRAVDLAEFLSMLLASRSRVAG